MKPKSTDQKKLQDKSTTNKSDTACITEVLNVEVNGDTWTKDSGATNHITIRKEWFSTFTYFKSPVKVFMGNNTSADGLGQRTINIETYVDGKWLPGHMEDVLYVPDL